MAAPSASIREHLHLHGGEPLATAGLPVTEAGRAVVMVHGRGDRAEGFLGLAEHLENDGFAFLAIAASSRTPYPHSWYPYGFMAPTEHNEPGLSSGLARLGEALEELGRAGISARETLLLGFSQGACLMLEYVARNPRRYGGVAALSGGLVGPPGTTWAADGPSGDGSGLDGTPVFLGCSDRDPHIPLARVKESTMVLWALGGEVEERIYPGMSHTIVEDELAWVRDVQRRL
ncbi:MAG: hypothetical protein MI919_36325 [Holophagales bacterium]|nr:hypothetical protein [Holophagales bacterium]